MMSCTYWEWNTFSLRKTTRRKWPKRFSLENLICELTVSQVEPLFDSVIRTYYKLNELGIKEVDGKIVFIDNMEVSHE